MARVRLFDTCVPREMVHPFEEQRISVVFEKTLPCCAAHCANSLVATMSLAVGTRPSWRPCAPGRTTLAPPLPADPSSPGTLARSPVFSGPMRLLRVGVQPSFNARPIQARTTVSSRKSSLMHAEPPSHTQGELQ